MGKKLSRNKIPTNSSPVWNFWPLLMVDPLRSPTGPLSDLVVISRTCFIHSLAAFWYFWWCGDNNNNYFYRSVWWHRSSSFSLFSSSAYHSSEIKIHVCCRINTVSQTPSDWSVHLTRWRSLSKELGKLEIFDNSVQSTDKFESLQIFTSSLRRFSAPCSLTNSSRFFRRDVPNAVITEY